MTADFLLPGQAMAGQRHADREAPGGAHPDLLPGYLASAARGCARRAAFAGGQPAPWYGYLRELGLPSIAVACARRAARKARDIPDPWPRADAQADAAIALATAGRPGEALDHAGGIGVASARVRALSGIAVVVATSAVDAPTGTTTTEATTRTGTAPTPPARATATGTAAKAIAWQALGVARTVGFPGSRADALAMAAEALAEAGLGAEAAEVAATIGHPWARAEAYAHAAAALPASAPAIAGTRGLSPGTGPGSPATFDAAFTQALAWREFCCFSVSPAALCPRLRSRPSPAGGAGVAESSTRWRFRGSVRHPLAAVGA